LPEPKLPEIGAHPYGIIVTGIGGTGIVTIGAVLGMAAHLDGKGCGIIDMAGLAQKGGAVLSHLRIARRPSSRRRPTTGSARRRRADPGAAGTRADALWQPAQEFDDGVVEEVVAVPRHHVAGAADLDEAGLGH